MGCKHYFVVDLLEDLVDENDSRSCWRTQDHDKYQLVSQLNVAIQKFWSRSPPRLKMNRPIASTQQVSPINRDLHLFLNWSSCCHERNVFGTFCTRETCIYFLEVGALFFLRANNVSPRFIMIWIWSGWLGTFCLSNNFWTPHFLHPIIFQGKILEETEVTQTLLQFPINFRDTIVLECFMQNDGVRPFVMELRSFLQSQVDVNPMHRILFFSMLYACIAHDAVHSSRSYQDPCVFCPKDPETVCLFLKFCPPGVNPELMMECKLIDCTSDVINILGEIVRDNNIVSFWKIF